jgi:hypothetical protein
MPDALEVRLRGGLTIRPFDAHHEYEACVAFQEEIWAELRERGMPRALGFITGPSRTGDIEFDIQLGAHGPRNLHVIIVASA